jgi:hypothetical protein
MDSDICIIYYTDIGVEYKIPEWLHVITSQVTFDGGGILRVGPVVLWDTRPSVEHLANMELTLVIEMTPGGYCTAIGAIRYG